MTTIRQHRWYTVAEVWLMLVMIVATMTGSIALVVTAFEHRDDMAHGPSIAAPLPPTSAARAADAP